jgi:hypothetical protein
MNPDTDKLILPIEERRRHGRPIALDAIYALAAPRDACRTPGVSVERLSPREAFLELLKGTFNRRLVDQPRLQRQFGFMARLSDLVAVKRLTYLRAIDRREVRRRCGPIRSRCAPGAEHPARVSTEAITVVSFSERLTVPDVLFRLVGDEGIAQSEHDVTSANPVGTRMACPDQRQVDQAAHDALLAGWGGARAIAPDLEEFTSGCSARNCSWLSLP